MIWLVFGGLVMALGYAVVALFCLWPFGRTLVRRPDAGAGSLIGNVIWLVLAGWWLAVGHLLTGLLMCITIIGIPLGLANFKLIPVSLTPFGRDVVDLARRDASVTPRGSQCRRNLRAVQADCVALGMRR